MSRGRKILSVIAAVVVLSGLADISCALVDQFGWNVVLVNYLRGSAAFWHGIDPYAFSLRFGITNQFKYSPFFAMVLGIVKYLPPGFLDRLFVPAWITINAFVFWFGTLAWCSISPRRFYLWIVPLAACFVELDTSDGIRQINPLIAGLLFLGVALFQQDRQFLAGIVLALATNIKVFPVIFLLGLLPRARRWYVYGALLCGLLTYILPMMVVGPGRNWSDHLAWFRLVTHDTTGDGILDIESALGRLGLGGLGAALRLLIGASSLILFWAASFYAPRKDLGLWVCLGTTAFILVSPRTEVATFVVCIPSIVILWGQALERFDGRRRFALLALLCAAATALTFYSNRFDESLDDFLISEWRIRALKVGGTLILWMLSFAAVLVAVRQGRQSPLISGGPGTTRSARSPARPEDSRPRPVPGASRRRRPSRRGKASAP